MKRIAVLGSTGSIGRSTLSVVESYPDRFKVVSLAAGKNVEAALEQAKRWRPRVVSLSSERDADQLRNQLKAAGLGQIDVMHGPSGTVSVATHPDADFVDSEHNAVHQCLRGGRMEEVERIWLTASGGPFLNTPKSQFSSITVKQALNHPTWKMGRRITIDSATLMNKGFEVIEACRLFNLPPSKIQVIVHPQSTIHSMVEFVDGSILAQFSVADMRLPILYALTYPERIASEMRFPVMNLRHLEFLPPDMKKFPCLRLAYEAAEAGGAKTVALNAADEVAIAAFLEKSIGFDDIPHVIETVLSETKSGKLESIKKVLEADFVARQRARESVAQLTGSDALRPAPAS